MSEKNEITIDGVRSRNEGVNAGTLVAADHTACVLKNCRRLWHHAPQNENVSWYEGVANTGLSENSKVSDTSITKVIVEDYSFTECTRVAEKSIMNAIPHKQK